MSVTAAQKGRNLILTLEGVEPFEIAPLPALVGEQATDQFIRICAQEESKDGLEVLFQQAVDGVDDDLNPILGGPNWTRIKRTLSMAEGEEIIVPALYWQTTLGIEGVNAFIEGGGGMPGAKKALELLIWTLGISPTLTAPSSALETLIRKPGLTPLTSTPLGGAKPERLPRAERRRLAKLLRGQGSARSTSGG